MILNCNSEMLDLTDPVIMGIINCTPDSFYDGEIDFNEQSFLKVDRIVAEGAKIIDIGGMSSRPGAEIVNELEEWDRIVNTILYVKNNYPDILVSVDTIHSKIAEKALIENVHLINDISGGVYDSYMKKVVGSSQACFVMMHMKGVPKTMQKNIQYPKGVVLEICDYFKKRIWEAKRSGIDDIILDPGFGFSKSLEQNYEILKKMNVFEIFDKPILAGLSRKSMIYNYLFKDNESYRTPQNALNGTTALHMIALEKGAKILRVHDVKEAKECLALHKMLKI